MTSPPSDDREGEGERVGEEGGEIGADGGEVEGEGIDRSELV